MTPFEQKVTEALRAASQEWGHTVFTEGDFVRWVAPRVSAAIEAAEEHMAERGDIGGPRLDTFYREAEKAALAALRKETP